MDERAAKFDQNFRNVIRVGFNWNRFFNENWPVDLVVVDSIDDLTRCYIPWYIGPDGEEVAYDDPRAVPMKLTDVPKAIDLLNDERRDDIQQYVEKFREQPAECAKFAVPSYALPDNQYFILDANHRLSALVLESVPFEVTLWNVRGPLDSNCLLDLNHLMRRRDPPHSDDGGKKL